MLISLLFYGFATILVLSALQVITAKNPIYSVLFLVLAFVTSACLWMMLNAEFLSLILIVVYVGAVMILFLFVVMMLDIDIETMRAGFWKNLPLALVLGVIILFEMVLVLVSKPMVINDIPGVTYSNIANANQLGWVLYTEYSYPVELASMILLLGLVAAVALTLRKTDKNAKYQNIRKQVAVNAQDRFELIQMDAQVEFDTVDNKASITDNSNAERGIK
ncbi:MAG: NADH-quinone oxidoreductase subunit J [Burkholderiales bacterium]|nr:NADH-quinone oxidoreductase subunit J [Burkholderiales bacterium]